MTLQFFLLMATCLIGHVAIFIYVVNRLHATSWAHPVIKLVDSLWSTVCFVVPFAIAARILYSAVSDTTFLSDGPWSKALLIYVAISLFTAVCSIADRIKYIIEQRRVSQLVSIETKIINMASQLQGRQIGDRLTHLLSHLPGNEIYELSIQHKQFRLESLPADLDGLSIAHLSDLHMTGQMNVEFYDEVVRQTNKLDADIVVITGDIIEKEHCLPWVAPTLGKLTSKYGVYYVLGNHEQRIHDTQLIRSALDDAGLIRIGSHWRKVEVNNHPVVIAGNELPWFTPPADLSDCPTHFDGKKATRILLTHTPDQLPWAVDRNFDLMLAGHTHGGQVRFPILGPILAPSMNGVKHASGTFYSEPTLLHVSRGIAGTRPLRYNCRPELAKLTLRSACKLGTNEQRTSTTQRPKIIQPEPSLPVRGPIGSAMSPSACHTHVRQAT